jgi:hypothetical protein
MLRRKDIGCECRLNSSDSGSGVTVGSSEYNNESLGAIKCGEFLEYLSDYSPLKKGSVP